MKSFNYSSVTLNNLEEIFDIEKIHDRSVFDSWFSNEYNFAAEDNVFLERLINAWDLCTGQKILKGQPHGIDWATIKDCPYRIYLGLN